MKHYIKKYPIIWVLVFILAVWILLKIRASDSGDSTLAKEAVITTVRCSKGKLSKLAELYSEDAKFKAILLCGVGKNGTRDLMLRMHNLEKMNSILSKIDKYYLMAMYISELKGLDSDTYEFMKKHKDDFKKAD
jgi:hypothetical protein